MPALKLPRMGFGTWQLAPPDCISAVLKAIEVGYRLIDTAQMYKNEEAVGAAVSKCGVPREELIVATKVGVFNYRPERVLKSTEASLKRLGLKYVDILYVHWPARLFGYKASTTLKAFSQLVDDGKVRHVGVSNFTPPLLDEAIAACKRYGKAIVANQVEHHPLLQQREMRDYLANHDMYLVAYSPLVRGDLGDVTCIGEIARKHGVSEAQVALAWEMGHGAIPIPKATGEAHIEDNFAAQNLELDGEDVKRIEEIGEVRRLLNPPIIKPKW
ncbi:MAG: aldo/keto reductase [Candidatus Lokiarchaeota archaeon]|nr:aldo/keto reductase [Candidatus Lokiarchaeota archaeon]